MEICCPYVTSIPCFSLNTLMKRVVSFLIILSLLAEVSVAMGNHDCAMSCVRLETINSEAENCEVSATLLKMRSEQRTTLSKPPFLAKTYQRERSLKTATASKSILNNHSVKQFNSPIYLSNRVFLI